MEQLWKRTARHIVYAMIVIFSCVILSMVFMDIQMGSIFAGNGGINPVFAIVGIIFLLAAVCGAIWYLTSLYKFSSIQPSDQDRQSVKMVFYGCLLFILGYVILFLALRFSHKLSTLYTVSTIFTIMGLLANVMVIAGFYRLSKTPTYSVGGRSGALLLTVYGGLGLLNSILQLVGLSFTLITDLIELACVVLLFVGWVKISNNPPEQTDAWAEDV